jgi:hypothetical protein
MGGDYVSNDGPAGRHLISIADPDPGGTTSVYDDFFYRCVALNPAASTF